MQISSRVRLQTWGTRLRMRGGVAVAALRRPEILSYLVPPLLAAVAVQSWFERGRFIAAGDSAPFLRTNSFFELGSVWQHTFSGAGSPSFDMARMPELAVIRAVDLFGGSEQLAQRVFLTCIAMAVVFSVTFLVRSFKGPVWLAGVCGLFAFFNPYLLVSFPNALPAWTVACMAALAGILIRVGKGQRMPASAFVLVSAACSYLVLNPALFVTTCCWALGIGIGTALLVDATGRARLRRFLQVAIPWALLANLWWIAAWSAWLLESRNSFTGQTDVQAWSWTHARNSLPNVLSLNGHWGWDDPKYFPYSSGLERVPWNLLRFGIPLLALAAPFVIRGTRRKIAWAGLGGAALIIFLGKGLHEPLSSLNLLLYRHVPGMWLFREPFSKLGAILVVLFSILLFFTLCRVWSVARTQTHLGAQMLAGGAAAAVLLGLIYPYPMWTGAVIPDSRPVLPSAHVEVPAPWLRIADILNRGDPRGKVLLLPLNDYYQIPTTWGYYGADRIPKNLLEAPTLQLFPGGYFSDDDRFRAMVADIEVFLLNGDKEGAARLLRALGVSHVIVRRDIDRSFPARSIAPGKPLRDTLDNARGVEPVVHTKVASVYAVEDAELFDVVSSAVAAGKALEPGQMSSLVASIPPDAAVYEAAESDSVVVPVGENGMSFDATWSRAHVSARLAARQFLAVVEKSEKDYRLTLRRAPVVLVDDRMSEVGIVGGNHFDSRPIALKIDRRTIDLSRGMGLTGSARGGRAEVFGRSALGAPLAISELYDCNRSDERTIDEAGIRAYPLPSEPAPAIGLRAEAHSACVYGATDSFRDNIPYEMEFSYRTLQGRSARVCFWQEGPNRCAELPQLESGQGWNEFKAIVLPANGTKNVRLFLYADGGGGRTTRTEYREIVLRPLSQLGHVRVHGSNRPDVIDLDTGNTHEVVVRWPGLRGHLEPLSEVHDCNAKDALSPRQAGLSAEPLDASGHSVRLRAREHSACVSSSFSPVDPGALYRVEMLYRTLSGRRARLCVWQEGVGRCARLSPLEESRSWRLFTSTFRAERGTTGLKLLVYADGAGGLETTTEYREVSMRPVPPASVVLRDVTPPPTELPSLSWVRDGSSTYRVTLAPRNAPSILTMNETFSDGWEANVLSSPEGTELEHERVNGYANGWRVGPGDEITLEIRYRPDLWYRMAGLVSAIAIIIALLALVGPMLTRRGFFPNGRLGKRL